MSGSFLHVVLSSATSSENIDHRAAVVLDASASLSVLHIDRRWAQLLLGTTAELVSDLCGTGEL